MTTNTGGSAFPIIHPPVEGITCGGVECYGLTIRDYFAAKATEEDIKAHIYGPIARQIRSVGSMGEKREVDAPSVRSREEAKYAYADAMLKARG